MKNGKEYLQNCSFVKCMLMLLVMFGHSIAFWTEQWIDLGVEISSPLLGYGYSWIDSFHIYAFALVSGYLFAFKIHGGGIAHIYRSFKTKLRDCLYPIFLQ